MLTQRELKKMARLHERWLEGAPGGQYADFSGMELANLDFSGMNFEAATFRGAWIHGCDLSGNFTFADFRGAELRDCTASHCSFEGADFTDAKCQNFSIFRARFDGARLRRAQFDGCDFARCKLDCCDMTGVQFRDTELSWVATACSWGETPPARDMKTLLAEETFKSSMMVTGLWDNRKIAEWMDEAWSRAQDQSCGCEPKPGPREPEYRELLSHYAAAFAQARAQFPLAIEALFSHGEHFAPNEINAASAQLAEGSSMETVLSMECHGLLRPENAGDLAHLKEAVELIVEGALGGEPLVDLEVLNALYGFDGLHELTLHDLLREREEVADARLDHVADMILTEIKPEFLHGMTMMMQ